MKKRKAKPELYSKVASKIRKYILAFLKPI